MREFTILLRSVQDVQNFVSLATVQPFPVLVGTGNQQINGKSFMGMFCLDCTAPLTVTADCDEQAFDRFVEAAGPFLIK